MSDFAQLVASWQPFYLLTGTAASTLIGLLFVAMSIHTEMFRQRVPTGLEHFAALTFNCYFYVLLIAILFMIPRLSPLGLGIPIALLAALGLANALVQQQRARKYRLEREAGSLASRFTFPIVSLAALLLMAIGILAGIETSFYGVVVIIILLLGSASQNAWALLIVREVPSELEPREGA